MFSGEHSVNDYYSPPLASFLGVTIGRCVQLTTAEISPVGNGRGGKWESFASSNGDRGTAKRECRINKCQIRGR
jgi:hypothetical protein